MLNWIISLFIRRHTFKTFSGHDSQDIWVHSRKRKIFSSKEDVDNPVRRLKNAVPG